ncbi:hypothetical protein V5E97_06310 [Singulisphaera sp. Ch08]|uniref:Uncharacterized protein n=1 Tax=Singulisphaera sp. Ch08 TaxID=3120278 RepID=A0AAU7CK82_9BACT
MTTMLERFWGTYFVIVLSLSATSGARAGGERISVEVKATSTRFLIGEPVTLDLIVRNTTAMELVTYEVLTAELEAQGVFIAQDEGAFKQFLRGGLGYGLGNWITLGPGKRLLYRLRVLYTPPRSNTAFTEEEKSRFLPGGLAFDRSENYRIKVVYPLRLKGDDRSVPIDSNVVAIRVREPEGADAQVWRRIREDDVLAFIQTGDVPIDREMIVSTVVDLLEAFPNSGYRLALRHALRRFYGDWPRLPKAEWQRIRSLLSLSPEIDRFFPNDERLDSKVVNIPKSTTIARVLAFLSRQFGVGMDTTATVGRQPFNGPANVSDLRGLMQSIARDLNARWFRRGDRYVLWDREEIIQDRTPDR